MTMQKPYLQILIAEKEPDIRNIYKRYFVSAGLEPVIVSNGKECLDIISDHSSFDIVIIDNHMDDIDGISLARKIREKLPDQRIVLTSTALPADGQSLDLKSIGISKEDVLIKPFRFAALLSLIKPAMSRVNKIRSTDHVLAFYDSQEEELQEAVAFIKSAFRSNETALFVMRKDTDIEDIKARLARNGIDVDKLLATSSLIFMRNEDWYIPDDRVDKRRIIAQWYELVDRCINNGTKGLRAFCMMDCFFENDFVEEVVDYEHTLPAKFDIPFVPICAYRKQDIDSLSQGQLERLLVCHNHVWMGKE